MDFLPEQYVTPIRQMLLHLEGVAKITIALTAKHRRRQALVLSGSALLTSFAIRE